MPTSCLDLDTILGPQAWRLMGFWSSIVGFICFALGSFQKLFGRWNLLKMVVYFTISCMFSLFMLYAKHMRERFPRAFLLKLLVSYLVLLSTSLYSYYEDRVDDDEMEGKGHLSILSLISFGSFALMSISLSTQVQPGFEVGMSNFFLGCLTLGVMKKNLLLGLGVAVVCFLPMGIRMVSEHRRRRRTSVLPPSRTHHRLSVPYYPGHSIHLVSERRRGRTMPLPSPSVSIPIEDEIVDPSPSSSVMTPEVPSASG